MANLFVGPSTPQMRITMFLIGAAALAAGIYSSVHRIEASAADQYGIVDAYCGTAFDPVPARNFFPELGQACSQAIAPWLPFALMMFAVAGLFLIRFLYMLVGSKSSSR